MNLFVSNLNFRIQESELADAFSQFGDVSAVRIITDRETHRSRGFGFVEMPNDDEARAAIEGLNEKELAGRPINVREAEDRPRRDYGERRRY
ncbi:MAG TPA: RNA-binding protein [Bacteroidaceae bacterium]|nr:RNA-binding protein [Bacteroidaceae bacterium]